MPRFDPLQNAFVAGELTPRLEGRDDIRQYDQGMRQSVNQIVLPQGAVMHRSGTRFESETKNNGPVVLRPFEVGLDQAFILELGDEYMRFHANEGQLVLPDAPFAANAVNFNGVDNSASTTLFTGASSSKLLVSCWFNINTPSTSPFGGPIFVHSSASDPPDPGVTESGGIYIAVLGDGSFFVDIRGENVVMWQHFSTIKYTDVSNPGWHHALVAMDTALSRFQIYIDGVLSVGAPESFDSFDTEMIWSSIPGRTGPNTWEVGRLALTPEDQSDFDLAEVYVNRNESLDLSIEANRLKFRAAGKPVDLGTFGATPTGFEPLVFLTGPTVDWHTNKGTGGGLTENGVITTATTSPSD